MAVGTYMIKWTMHCCLFVKVDSCPATYLPVASPVCFSTVNPRLSTWSRAAARWLTAEAAVCWTFASLSSWTVTHISAAPGFPRKDRYPFSVIRRSRGLAPVPQLSSLHLIRGAASPCSRRTAKRVYIPLRHEDASDAESTRRVSCSLRFSRVSNQRNMTARTAVWTFQH